MKEQNKIRGVLQKMFFPTELAVYIRTRGWLYNKVVNINTVKSAKSNQSKWGIFQFTTI